MHSIKRFALAIMAITAVGIIQAQSIEQFQYTAGNITANSGGVWTAHSGAGTNPVQVVGTSLSYPGLSNVLGGAVTFLASGEDVARAITAMTPAGSTTAYVSAVVSIATAGATGDYFLHLIDGAQAGGALRGRLFVRGSGGAAQFGLRYSSGDVIQWESGTHAFGTPLFMVVKLTSVSGATNDTAQLFINPALDSTEPAPVLTCTQTDVGHDWANLDFVAVRQGTAGNTVTGSVDSIRTGVTWSQVANSNAGAVPVAMSGFTVE